MEEEKEDITRDRQRFSKSANFIYKVFFMTQITFSIYMSKSTGYTKNEFDTDHLLM